MKKPNGIKWTTYLLSGVWFFCFACFFFYIPKIDRVFRAMNIYEDQAYVSILPKAFTKLFLSIPSPVWLGLGILFSIFFIVKEKFYSKEVKLRLNLLFTFVLSIFIVLIALSLFGIHE